MLSNVSNSAPHPLFNDPVSSSVSNLQNLRDRVVHYLCWCDPLPHSLVVADLQALQVPGHPALPKLLLPNLLQLNLPGVHSAGTIRSLVIKHNTVTLLAPIL